MCRPFLAEGCNFIAMTGYCHKMLSVCSLSTCRLSSVSPVYCDKTAQVRIMQFLLKCILMP